MGKGRETSFRRSLGGGGCDTGKGGACRANNGAPGETFPLCHKPNHTRYLGQWFSAFLACDPPNNIGRDA